MRADLHFSTCIHTVHIAFAHLQDEQKVLYVSTACRSPSSFHFEKEKEKKKYNNVCHIPLDKLIWIFNLILQEAQFKMQRMKVANYMHSVQGSNCFMKWCIAKCCPQDDRLFKGPAFMAHEDTSVCVSAAIMGGLLGGSRRIEPQEWIFLAWQEIST